MGDAELVEVMDMGESEDDGREEDDGAVGGAGKEEDGNGSGAEEDLFCNGTLKRRSK